MSECAQYCRCRTMLYPVHGQGAHLDAPDDLHAREAGIMPSGPIDYWPYSR